MTKNSNVFTIIIILFVFLGIFHHIHPNDSKADSTENKIRMAYIAPKESMLGKWLNLIYTEALKRIGLTLIYEEYPGKRCTVLADAGKVDGELARIFSYGEDHPNLIRVEESPFSIRFIALAIKPIQLNGWESLRGTEYNIVSIRGVRKFQEKLPGLVRKENLTLISQWVQGLKMLIAGRVDIFLDVDFGASRLLKTDQFRNSGIREVGLMEEEPTYAYLYKKHRLLATKLATVLKDMKAEGLIERFRAVAEQESD